MPAGPLKPIKEAFWAIGMIQEGNKPLSQLEDSEEISSFLRDFYADDIVLFKKVRAAYENVAGIMGTG